MTALAGPGVADAASLLEVGGNRRLVLDDVSVWFVERGDVDVFSALFEDGEPIGARRHLLRVGSGRIFLGMGADTGHKATHQRRFVAVGTSGTRLVRASRKALDDLLAAPRSAERARALIETWIGQLFQAISRGLPARSCTELDVTGQEVELREPVVVRPRAALSWIRHLDGKSLLLGRQELVAQGEGFIPIDRQVWLEVQPPARLMVARTDQLPGSEALWHGLDWLAASVQRHCEIAADDDDKANADRALRASAASRATIEHACSRLAAALLPDVGTRVPSDEAAQDAPLERSDSALLTSCRLVGDALGVTITAPSGADILASTRDPLAVILRSSRLRGRKVALRGDWWRGDHGPLVGFLAEGNRPVALLRGSGGYLVHDSAAQPPGTGRLVDADVAATLEPFAYALYRPFPDVQLKMNSILRFAARGCGRDLFMVVVMALTVTVLGMVPSVATGILFNDVIPGAHRSQLVQMTILLLTCSMAHTGFTAARGLALLRLQHKMGTAVQAAVWDRLMRLPLTFFRPYTAGDLATRAMAIEGIQQALSGATITAILSGIFSLGNLAMMFYYSSDMAWRALLLLGVAVVATVLGALLQLGPQRAVMKLQAKTSGLVLQLLTCVSKLRVAGAEARAFAKWALPFARQRRLQIQVRRIANWLGAFTSAFPVLASVVIFWAALPLLADRGSGLRTGDFLAFGAAFSSCLGSLLGTCMALVGALGTVSLYEQAKPILQTLPEVTLGRSDPGELTGDIEIQHLVFRYQTDGPPALRDISLRIAPGEFVALVGPSGSGKSTMLRLLLGFETPESGSIYYDGQDIRGLDIQEVRRKMGVVLQNGRLIAGDFLTNIVASGSATIEEAWEAAAMAGIADDIKAMPMRMFTVIGEGAGTLSGGQRQRLMIARAIVNRPRILLFDEATSALDNRTQAIVSASLGQLKATRIVVAHRLSTIVNADRIYVIERGRIVQTGTYSQLMEQKGTFADLASRQLV